MLGTILFSACSEAGPAHTLLCSLQACSLLEQNPDAAVLVLFSATRLPAAATSSLLGCISGSRDLLLAQHA